MFNRYSINPHEAVRKAAQQVDAYLADRRASGGICPGTVQRRLTACASTQNPTILMMVTSPRRPRRSPSSRTP